jgi:hypothetical protein
MDGGESFTDRQDGWAGAGRGGFPGESEGLDGPQRGEGDSAGDNKACDGAQGGSNGWDEPIGDPTGDSMGEPIGKPIDQFCSSCN